jgi:DNA helicase-2/ATP-dependent DNA helicase PcrA
MDLFKEKLNQIKKDKEQYEAFLSENNTVVIAGPGSGKTTVLTLKIMKLLMEEIKPPRGLACVTFSRAAAKEFKDRLNALGYQKRENVFLGTVHSFCISEIISPF